MYEYRRLTEEEKQAVVQERLRLGFPAHRPPHMVRDREYYLLTAVCYNHTPILSTSTRRQKLLDMLFEECITNGVELLAWVVLTNHYHLLVYLPDFDVLSNLFRLVHGRTSFAWNGEDGQRGRKVWYRFTDRAIRSEGHYYTTINYIHYNPVKHNHVQSPYEWAESSVHWYLENWGREWLRDSWRNYPVRDYGKGWDTGL